MAQIKVWYQALQPRERMLVMSVAGILGIALLYLVLFGPLSSELNKRHARMTAKQQDLIWMRSVATNVRIAAAARGNQGGQSGIGGESLVVLINRTAQQAGIASALVNQAPQGDNGIRVRLEGASFDAIVTWLGILDQQFGVRVDTASVDRSDKTGIVNASIMLTRGAH